MRCANKLVPKPDKVIEKDGVFIVPEVFTFSNDSFPSWCFTAFEERMNSRSGTGQVCITVTRKDDIPKEGYVLEVEEKSIQIFASDERGVIWALTSLYLLAQDGEAACCTVEDSPRYEHRGQSLDCSRHFFTAEEVKKIIEGLALAKINVLHWHLADDQGWRIESKKYPLLQQMSGEYYTQEEIREIDLYARDRGVEVVPEIDMPGHNSALLAAYPQYRCTGEKVEVKKTGGIYPVILCPGKEDTFVFLEDLIKEVSSLFRSKRFHMGGDEAPKDKWKECPDCRKRMAEEGLSSEDDLQGYFSCRVAQTLRALGKTVILWNEGLLTELVPENAQIQYWTLNYRETAEKWAREGKPWIYSDMFELYLDYPHSMTPLKKVFETVPHFGKDNWTGSMLGMESCMWCEHVASGELLEERIFPRVLALAETTWCREGGDYQDFLDRLRKVLDAYDAAGICFTKEDHWDPEGKARRDEAISYMTGSLSQVEPGTKKRAAPSREFVSSFFKKFFKLSDIIFLIKAMIFKK